MGQQKEKQAKPLQDKASTDKGKYEKEVADREKCKKKGAGSGNHKNLGKWGRYFCIYTVYTVAKILVKTYQK